MIKALLPIIGTKCGATNTRFPYIERWHLAVIGKMAPTPSQKFIPLGLALRLFVKWTDDPTTAGFLRFYFFILSLTERKKLRNLFNSVKRSVKMVLMHADSFPSTPDKQFKEVLRKIATAAEERIRKDFGFGDKPISHWMLADHPMTKTLEKTLNLPENTPQDIRKFLLKTWTTS